VLEIPMPPQKDDLEAVRLVADALEGFEAKDQERIIRWAREKLGLATVPAVLPAGSTQPPTPPPELPAPNPATPTGSKDLKTFVAEKKPKNDVQFATTVAYYYRFEAPENLRKKEINGDDLQEGCRLVGRERFTNPGQTLRNAHTLGLLNKGIDSGFFAVNSVGENLVAVTLPGDGGSIPRTKKSKKKKKKKKLKRKKLTKSASKK
jgi:hypothetical protein